LVDVCIAVDLPHAAPHSSMLVASIITYFLVAPRPPRTTLFPYTTLFRSSEGFLPGYSFPRLPLAAYIPGTRLGGTYVQRPRFIRSEEHTSELQSRENLVCRLLLEKKKLSLIVHSRQRTALTLEIYSPPHA